MEDYIVILADQTKPSTTLYAKWIFKHYVNRTVRSDPTVVWLLNEFKFLRDIPPSSFWCSMHWDGWDGSTRWCENFSISPPLWAHTLSKLVVPFEEEEDDDDSLPGLIPPSNDASSESAAWEWKPLVSKHLSTTSPHLVVSGTKVLFGNTTSYYHSP